MKIHKYAFGESMFHSFYKENFLLYGTKNVDTLGNHLDVTYFTWRFCCRQVSADDCNNR